MKTMGALVLPGMKFGNKQGKQNKLAHRLYALCAFFVLFSCGACMHVNEVDFILSDKQPKLVVQCALTPNDAEVMLKLTQTFPVGSIDSILEKDLLVLKAEVFLTNNKSGQTVQLVHKNETLPYYTVSQNEFKIVAGVSYELAIKAPGFVPVRATTQVPEKAVQWQTTQIVPIKIYIMDGVEFKGVYINIASSEVDPLVYYLTNSWHEDYGDRYKSCFVLDYTLIGDNKRLVSFQSLAKIKELVLITPSVELYQYLSLEEFFMNNDLSTDVGSFTDVYTGILPHYTNIENGFGVFGSYLKKSINYE